MKHGFSPRRSLSSLSCYIEHRISQGTCYRFGRYIRKAPGSSGDACLSLRGLMSISFRDLAKKGELTLAKTCC